MKEDWDLDARLPTRQDFVARLFAIHAVRKATFHNREIERLTRRRLVDQEIKDRLSEFHENVQDGDAVSPSFSTLHAFYKESEVRGDEAALEWSRRQLENRFGRATEEQRDQIDLVGDRSDTVHTRLVARFRQDAEAYGPHDLTGFELLASRALAGLMPNECAAAYLVAVSRTKGTAGVWVKRVYDGIETFHDAAIRYLVKVEAGSDC